MNRKILKSLFRWKEKKNKKPLLLKGARQVGKTYILKYFGKIAFEKVHYINFEEDKTLGNFFENDLKPDRIIRDLSFYVNSSINLKNDLIIFDEIQECPRALTSLKYFCEKLEEISICAAGSLLGIQLGDSSFPVGKIEELELYPMCFEEFLEASEGQQTIEYLNTCINDGYIPETFHNHLWDQLKIFFIVGGLPEVVQQYIDLKDDFYNGLINVRKLQNTLVNAYLADIAKHSGKENAMHIERIWKNIPAQLAREQDGSIPKFKFKGVVPGVSAYSRLAGAIDWLNTAGLIIKIHITNSVNLPFSAFTSENRFKLCLFDVGILGASSNLSPAAILKYDYGYYKGYFAENFIAQEFICNGINSLYSWKKNTAEVEFVIDNNGDVLPIEVKSGWITQAKSLKVFNERYKPKYKTIMSAKNLKIDIQNKTHNYPLYLASRFPLI